MRPIKFKGRGKYGDHYNKWVNGYLVETYECESKISEMSIVESLELFGYGEANWNDVIAVDPDTVCQFTGLCDRFNNEIYEGDIVELEFPNGRTDIEYVSFNEGRFVSIDSQKPYRQDALYLYLDCTRVIGNIHDTPEFLNTISK